MPVNKNAMIRYQALDRCFKNSGRNYTIDDLTEVCNQALISYNGAFSSVKKRQVYEDIKFMKSEEGYAVPLEKYRQGRRMCYRYEDRKFSINNQPINDAEANQINATLSVLQRFKGLPHFEWLQEILPKMQSSFGLQQHTSPVFQFEQNPYLKGIEYLEPLYQHIIRNEVLEITFKDFNNPNAVVFSLHPYLLKQYNKRWFLISWNADKQRIWVTALDRIEAIERSLSINYIPNTIDLEDYFDDVLGVTKYKEEVLQKILLKVYKPSIAYILTKPLHHSQRKKTLTDDYMIIELQLMRNYELESLILSYGDHIEVLAPEGFRKKITERIKNAQRRYD